MYVKLLHSIRQIRIFDNHSHPGFADDPDVDAMASPPGSSALRIRADSPELITASKALFRYPYADFSTEHTRWLIERKAQLRREKGNHYFVAVLDQLGLEAAIANRVAMPAYLDKRRFPWAFFVYSFFFPFDNSALRDANVDEQVYVPLQEQKLRRELRQAGLTEMPGSLAEYLQSITRVLELDRANGRVAIKFEQRIFVLIILMTPHSLSLRPCTSVTKLVANLPLRSTRSLKILSFDIYCARLGDCIWQYTFIAR